MTMITPRAASNNQSKSAAPSRRHRLERPYPATSTGPSGRCSSGSRSSPSSLPQHTQVDELAVFWMPHFGHSMALLPNQTRHSAPDSKFYRNCREELRTHCQRSVVATLSEMTECPLSQCSTGDLRADNRVLLHDMLALSTATNPAADEISLFRTSRAAGRGNPAGGTSGLRAPCARRRVGRRLRGTAHCLLHRPSSGQRPRALPPQLHHRVI